MSTDQRVVQTWETPPTDVIVGMARSQVAAMEDPQASTGWVGQSMDFILLRTIGRRSGRVHKVPLPIWRDPSGCPVVVASFAGEPQHPAWFLNLCDRAANPAVLCRLRDESYWSRPEVPEGEERALLWAQLIEDRAWYADYQARTSRLIPLVRLPKSRPA